MDDEVGLANQSRMAAEKAKHLALLVAENPDLDKNWPQEKLFQAACSRLKPNAKNPRGDGKITIASFENWRMRYLGAERLAAALVGNSFLTELCLRNNNLKDRGTAALAPVLPQLRLRKLDLSENEISDVGATHLCEGSCGRFCEWFIEAGIEIVVALQNENPQGHSGGLKTHPTLDKLILTDNNIRDAGASSLADMLRLNTHLQTLSLRENDVGDEGILALVNALKRDDPNGDQNLERKDKKQTETDGGGTSQTGRFKQKWNTLKMAMTMSSKTTTHRLTALDLTYNKFSDVGASAIVKGLEFNFSILDIPFRTDSVSKEIRADLDDCLLRNSLEPLTAQIVANDPECKALDLCSRSVGLHSMHRISSSLALNCTLTKLLLRDNNLGNRGCELICKALLTNSSGCRISHLSLSNNNIGTTGAQSLALVLALGRPMGMLEKQLSALLGEEDEGAGVALAAAAEEEEEAEGKEAWGDELLPARVSHIARLACRAIVRLDLGGNPLGVVGVTAIAAGLIKAGGHSSVETLSLPLCSIGEDGAVAVLRMLESVVRAARNLTLTSIDITNNNVSRPLRDRVNDSLARNRMRPTLERLRANDPTLTQLDLARRGLGNTTALAIAAALGGGGSGGGVNTTLTSLDFRQNDLSDEGVLFFLPVLEMNSKLTSLLLTGNSRVSVDAAAKVMDMLAKNKIEPTLARLRSDEPGFYCLNLSLKSVGDKAAGWISNALKWNQTLREINLKGNLVSDEEVMRGGDLPLTTLDLSGNRVGAAGAHALGQMLLHDECTLTALYLGANHIGDSGARALAQGLPRNESLNVLDLHENSIGDGGCAALSKALQPAPFSMSERGEAATLTAVAGAASSPSVSPSPTQDSQYVEAPIMEKSGDGGDEDERIGNGAGLGEPTSGSSEQEGLGVGEGKTADVEAAANEEQPVGAPVNRRRLLHREERERQEREADLRRMAAQEAARFNTTLRYLDLQKNVIGDDGAAALAQHLDGNTSLIEVNLRDNPLGKLGRGSVAYLTSAGGQMSVVVHSLVASVLSWNT